MRATDRFETMANFPTGVRSMLSVFRRNNGFLGLDVAEDAVRLVEVKRDADGIIVSEARQAALSTASLSATLGALVRRHAIRSRRVATAVPDADVITRHVTIPVPANGDFASAVRVAAEQSIPENLAKVNVDYQVLGPVSNGRQVEVLLVAARTELVDSRTASLRSASLKPVIVDVNSCALLNAFEANYDAVYARPLALIHLGERQATMNVVQERRSLVAVDVPVGSWRTEGTDGNRAVIADLVEEIHHAVSFYWSGAANDSLEVIYLSGTAACVPALPQLLCERMQTPVEILDPFARQRLDAAIDTPELRAQAPVYAIALGLALRGYAES